MQQDHHVGVLLDGVVDRDAPRRRSCACRSTVASKTGSSPTRLDRRRPLSQRTSLVASTSRSASPRIPATAASGPPRGGRSAVDGSRRGPSATAAGSGWALRSSARASRTRSQTSSANGVHLRRVSLGPQAQRERVHPRGPGTVDADSLRNRSWSAAPVTLHPVAVAVSRLECRPPGMRANTLRRSRSRARSSASRRLAAVTVGRVRTPATSRRPSSVHAAVARPQVAQEQPYPALGQREGPTPARCPATSRASETTSASSRGRTCSSGAGRGAASRGAVPTLSVAERNPAVVGEERVVGGRRTSLPEASVSRKTCFVPLGKAWVRFRGT